MEEKKNKPSLVDSITAIFGEAITDIRHKVVEEPWFGRETTPSASPYAAQGMPASFAEYQKSRETQEPQKQPEQQKEQQEPER